MGTIGLYIAQFLSLSKYECKQVMEKVMSIVFRKRVSFGTIRSPVRIHQETLAPKCLNIIKSWYLQSQIDQSPTVPLEMIPNDLFLIKPMGYVTLMSSRCLVD